MTSSRVYKTQGVILARKNVGEADKILTVFTNEYGKLRVIAKGIRRVSSRRSPHLEVFSHVRLIIHHSKTMDSITEAETIESFPHIRRDLSRIGIGYYLCEIVDTLLALHQEHRDVFALLIHALRQLDTNPSSNLPVFAGRISMELLRTLGFVAQGKEPLTANIVSYIEGIAEKRLKTPKFYRQLTHAAAI